MTSAFPPGTDDRHLVAAAQQGDRAALDALLRRHLDRVHAVCRRITANEADAADATQEALLAIVRGLPRFDGRSSFSTWIYRVATNASLDEVRRRRRRPDPGLPEHDHTSELAASTTLPGGAASGAGDDPGEVVAGSLTVDALLGTLPIEFRAPIVLRDICTLDYAEIAEVLSIPPGTVRSRIARGRAHLARLLSEHGNQPDPSTRPSRQS